MGTTTRTRRAKLTAAIGLLTMLFGALLTFAPGAAAVETFPPSVPDVNGKVDVCHRTNSASNPYVTNTVSRNAGNETVAEKDDHTSHLGPLWDPDTDYPQPRSDDAWGDIVPALDASDPPDGDFDDPGDYAGLNWTADGYAIWLNGCKPLDPVASLTIAKTIDPAPAQGVDPEFDFTGPGSETFKLGHGDSSSSFVLSPGAYTVVETAASGYDFEDVACTTGSGEGTSPFAIDNDSPASGVKVTLAEGDDVTCTFTNVPETTISTTLRIEKVVAGAAAPTDWSFPFTATGMDGFSLTDETPAKPATSVTPGTITIAETDAKGASSTSIVCTGNEVDEVVTGASVAVDVQSGEDVVCKFTNNFPSNIIITTTTTTVAPAASLQIIKAVTGDVPDAWSFDFTGDLGAFSLTNVSASNTEVDLEPGDYTVTEVADAIAELVDVTCTGASATVEDETVTVTLEDGDAAQCTFTNNLPQVEPSEVTQPPATTTTTTTEPPAEVLPEVVVRPTTLPRTGNETRNLAGVGAALLVFGAVLVGASRKELAQR